MAERVIEIATQSRRYPVVVGAGAMTRIGERVRGLGHGWRRAAIISDAGTGDVGPVEESLRAAGLDVVRAPAFIPSERSKTLETAGRMLEALTAARLDRGDVVVVVGGGVIGDVAGFAAATYRRGIAWVNCPSTLLSMVDASVGGKTGVNLAVGGAGGSLKKNMVGAFWQPSLVVADVAVLQTLPARLLRCGLAECLKHGLLAADFGDAGLWAWTLGKLERFAAVDEDALAELVARNVAVKAAVVGQDEREEAPAEKGGRALLNLGHTYAHVLETLPGQDLQHGEAVGLGLIAAAAAAEAVGLASPGLVEEVRGAVGAAGLPITAEALPTDDELIGLMMDDKKVAGGKLRLVLPRGAGRCVVVEGPERGVVAAGWGAVRG